MSCRSCLLLVLMACVPAYGGTPACPGAGTVVNQVKISALSGGFTGVLDPYDNFGAGVASVGDLDGDGVTDLVVGANGDDDGGLNQGALWVLFLNADGTVKQHLKISEGLGTFPGLLQPNDFFGTSVARIGDLDGDGIPELAVGAPRTDDGSTDAGAVWILFLTATGNVRHAQKISATQGGFVGSLNDSDKFGVAVTGLGDLDGDGIPDIAVGAIGDDDGAFNAGAVWVLFLNSDGTVRSEQKISATAGHFSGTLHARDWFGTGVTRLGDLDGDGTTEIAVGATGTDDPNCCENAGAVWVLFLRNDGTVRSQLQIASGESGFQGNLDPRDFFGADVAFVGDVDGDGITDLAVGATGDDDGATDSGALRILFLLRSGAVRAVQKISNSFGGFGSGNLLDPSDVFGAGIECVGDLNGDGIQEIAVSAPGDDDGGTNQGAVWILSLQGCGPPPCPADLNHDGAVDLTDLAEVLSHFGTPAGATHDQGDVDGDGDVDFGDLAQLLDAFGTSCP